MTNDLRLRRGGIVKLESKTTKDSYVHIIKIYSPPDYTYKKVFLAWGCNRGILS